MGQCSCLLFLLCLFWYPVVPEVSSMNPAPAEILRELKLQPLVEIILQLSFNLRFNVDSL